MRIPAAKLLVIVPACILFVSVCVFSQQPEPAKKKTSDELLQAWRAERAPKLMDDFGELAHFRDANAALPAPAAGENRVVFMGDSITEGWKLAESFPGKPYVNRGISGQTTPQMLVRFRQDVINLHPKVVIILAGTNDIAGNTGPTRDEDLEANYASFADLARANGIRVILTSILPVHNYTERSRDYFDGHPPERILRINAWIKDYCARNKLEYVDYFSALVDDKGLLRKELADDGLHPNADGYKIMAPLAEAAIERAIK